MSMQTFFLAMAMYPAAQAKAQEELDRIVGSDHPVTFEDRTSLPYVNALLKEVLRWHPVLPMALPHRVISDDVYNGYHIRAETIVLLNSWYSSISHTSV